MSEIYFSSPTRSSPNVLSKIGGTRASEQKNRCAEWVVVSYSSVLREVLAQEAEIMNALMQDLEDNDWEDAENVDEDIETGDKKSELERYQAETTEDPTPDFVTRSKLQAMIAPGMGRSTSHSNALT